MQSVSIITKVVRFEHRSWQGVLNTTLYDKVCQWLATGTSISSTNKTESHDIAEILEKVALKHPNPNQRCSRIMDLDLVFESGIKEPFLYPPQQSCRGVSWFHHVRPSVHPSVRPSVCRQILCRTITWVVLIRIFLKFLSAVYWWREEDPFLFWRFPLLLFQSYWTWYDGK